MVSGVAQMPVFAVMQTFSVTAAAEVIVAGAVYVFGPLVPEVGDPCTIIAVVAEVSVPELTLDGEGVRVQVSPVAVPSFWMDAVKACVFPLASGADIVGGLSVMVVAGILKFVVAQTVVDTDAQPCTVAFCEG
jgi:hypothetical protein